MEWLPVVQTVGIPVSILGILIYAIWKGSQTIMQDVVRPLIAEHLLTLKEVRESYKSLREDNNRLTNAHVELIRKIAQDAVK